MAEVQDREGNGPAAELDLIEQLLDLLTQYKTPTVLNYNVKVFDFQHLAGRSPVAIAELGARDNLLKRVETTLKTIQSDDLDHDTWDAFGDYPSLEDAYEYAGVGVTHTYWTEYDHGIDPSNWRNLSDQGTPEVLSADVAQFGEHYLDCVKAGGTDTEHFREQEAMLTDYALADVKPLFTLAD